MSEHPLLAEDEVRPCNHTGCIQGKLDGITGPNCSYCKGTGKLGNPDAEKVILIPRRYVDGFYWTTIVNGKWTRNPSGPHDSVPLAVTAARDELSPAQTST